VGIKLIKEVTQGQGATLSAGGSGVQYTRVFKMLLDAPVDINTVDVAAGITSLDGQFTGIGTLHPLDSFASCESVSVSPDGDSRLAYTVTLTYRPSGAIALDQAGDNNTEPDPREQAPDLRSANWSTSTTTIEVPSWWWIPRWGNQAGVAVPAFNPARDIVDGLTILQPIVNISVEQYCAGDQTQYSQYVGMVNENQGKLGSLDLFPRSVLFRSVSFKPHAEVIGRRKWRGWIGTFEFAYKANYNNYLEEFLGWDIAIPLAGFNIINQFGQDVDKGACHLELENEQTGAIKNWPNNWNGPGFPPGVQIAGGTNGRKMRANVLITTPTENGTRASQRPSASPVPLNEDGTPRDPAATRMRNGVQIPDPVLVRRYQMYKTFNMGLLNLRFR
jgi:hypothetical protein